MFKHDYTLRMSWMLHSRLEPRDVLFLLYIENFLQNNLPVEGVGVSNLAGHIYSFTEQKLYKCFAY